MSALPRLTATALALAGGLAFAAPAFAGCAGHQSADSDTLQTAMNDTGGKTAPAPTTKDSPRK